MKCKNCFYLLTILLFILFFVPSLSLSSEGADNNSVSIPWKRLQSHEANTLGYTKDNDDELFLDFKISLKYPIFHENQPLPPYLGFIPHFYFAFTGRFGQYIETRDSSPVIGKRFNPELFGRYWLDRKSKNDNYIDIGYGHESNGQSITSSEVYAERRTYYDETEDHPEFADDYISRGWDYIGLAWKKNWTPFTKKNHIFTTQLKLRYFVEYGLLQGRQEEYNGMESDPEGKPRKSVDGIQLKLKYKADYDFNKAFRSNQFTLHYTTGITDTFKYHTYRLEWVLEIDNMPVMVWASHGYNSDLACYYKKVTSYGVGFKLVSY